MNDEDFDPIEIKMSQALDRRFARFDVACDNSPKNPDDGVDVNGSVSFGFRRQTGAKGRLYEIGVKCAFLEIVEVNCSFKPNGAVEDIAQKGKLSERSSSTQSKGHDVNAEAGANADMADPLGAGRAKGNGGYRRSKKSEEKHERQYEVRRVYWTSGGCQFGERGKGDPFHPDGVLDGVFLNGKWGRLSPARKVDGYAARFTLMLPKGMLWVRPVSTQLKDLLPGSGDRQEAEAFEALKAEVAGWILQEGLSPERHPDGFDDQQQELVLAQGEVKVDLTKYRRSGAPDLLPAPDGAPAALPAPAAPQLRKPRRAPAKAKQ